MLHSVFIDKIGKIYDGNYNDAVDNFDRYRDLSQQGIGRFAQKNVYLLNNEGNIVKSYGTTAFKDGGEVLENVDVIKDFILGKKIDNSKSIESGFTAIQSKKPNGSSVLVYKNNDGQFPLITISNNNAIFHKTNFSPDSYINSMAQSFRDVCIKNAMKFTIE